MRTHRFRLIPGAMLLLASRSAWAQVVIQNQAITTGVHNYYNQNVSITNCWVVAAGTSNTATIRVYGGTLTIDGLSANGANGVDGVNGDVCEGDPPTSGTAGLAAFNVVLETWPSTTPGGSPGNWSIGVACGGLSADGGRGGSGGNGDGAGVCDGEEECTFHNAQDGATGMPGGNGGSITIRASGDITVTAPISAGGGDGGHGGSGGNGGLPGTQPGIAREGRNGGNGGAITLEHTSSAPSASVCSFGIAQCGGNYVIGGLASNGGSGGSGGRGGSQTTPKYGGNGGTGGNGGAISATVRKLAFTGWSGLSSGASAQGGFGGVGGEGGSGGSGSCLECDGDEYPLLASEGAPGGLGGDGGQGGTVTYTVVNNADFTYSAQSTFGGHGESAGDCGASGTGRSAPCEDAGPCPDHLFAINGAAGAAAGDGGDGGAININAHDINLYTGAALITEGGDGATAVVGADGTHVCCDGDLVDTGTGGQGGAGGKGGKGANIVLTYTNLSAITGVYFTCGGDGQDGGKGGNQFGSGGIGGAKGTSGTIKKNSLITLPFGCNPHVGATGAVGDDAPPCFGG